MWDKRYPFEDCAANTIELLYELESMDIARLVGRFSSMSPMLAQFVAAILAVDPSHRPDVTALIGAPWLAHHNMADLGTAREVSLKCSY
jgi:hypothetical protein